MNDIPAVEFLSLEEQDHFQLKKLKELCKYVHTHSPAYQKKFKKEGFHFQDIKNIEDFKYLTTTTKEDIQVNNWDFLCVPNSKIRDFSSTSGTLGQPIQIALTKNDLKRLAYNEKLSFESIGISQNDRVQLMLTLDKQFMAGMAYYKGLQEMGAAVIRSGPGLPQLQWELINKLQPTALVCVPSFFLKMLLEKPEYINFEKLNVRKILAIGESLKDDLLRENSLAEKIRSIWDIELYSTYASSEMQTAFTECNFRHGGHHHPELIYIELLDDNKKPVKAGEAGELVISTLGVEGMPLLRYETGDICKVYDEPCLCGRKTKRVGPILSRKKQMIKYKGTSLYPSTIIDVILQQDYIQDYVIEISKNEQGQDHITVYLENCNFEVDILKVIKPNFQHKLRVIPEIKFISTESMKLMQFPNNNRKPLKIIDKRMDK